MIAGFVKRHVRAIVIVSGVASRMMMIDFALLATSLGLHWWRPVWGESVTRVMLVGLAFLSTVYGLLYVLGLWFNARLYKRHGYDIVLVRKLIASAEATALCILCAVWSVLLLTGQPAALFLRLLGSVWIGTFVVLIVAEVDGLRRNRRRSLEVR